jgi:hypothetical protein
VREPIPPEKLGENFMHVLHHGASISPGILERIGAITVGWAMFEHYLEMAIWVLSNEDVRGAFPTTDRMQSKEKISRFLALAQNVGGDKWKAFVELAARLMNDVLSFRNALSHGHPAPGSSISNVRWRGEKRRRDSSQAHYEIWTTGCVVEGIDVLLKVVANIDRPWPDLDFERILANETHLRRIASMVGEAAHLTAYMNHEKN